MLNDTRWTAGTDVARLHRDPDRNCIRMLACRRATIGRSIPLLALLLVDMWTGTPAAQLYAPVVSMVVTLPDGQTKELSAAESSLAHVTLKDGTEYAFRPTMNDDRGTTTVVTIFKMTPSTEQLGAVEVKLGAAAVTSKTTPAFKVAVPRVGKGTT